MGQDRELDKAVLEKLGFKVTLGQAESYDKFVQAYHHIDALLILSIAEGGPASIPEAYALNVPLIARPVGMIPDCIDTDLRIMLLTDDPLYDAYNMEAFLRGHRAIKPARSHQNGAAKISIKSWRDTVHDYEQVIMGILSESAS